ncbi:tetraspanin-5 isoform X2 [Chrysoperla carnea]|uniref:tetraspanin-5 isoform X2 n=1 Tax=Chrysoperla carnea TaxID=189513 RepID=UPI001D05DE3F|nr:tetraspanin-5 isoform X2 [Chrysoperla carnea]
MSTAHNTKIPKLHVRKTYRRDTSEVSCCLKYMIFGFNVLFWLFGLFLLTVGIWAWNEKDAFNNLGRTTIALDPAFTLICAGTVTFIIGFTGCIGALRENTCLLSCYAIFLTIILALEMTAGVLGFIYKDWIKNKVKDAGILEAFIVHYREDPDQQNLIDWIQEDWLQCCGIVGPNDWDLNNYFNCSSHTVGSREACGVPFSCCKRKINEIIKNKQCGYDVRKSGYSGERNIFEKGCLRSVEDWMETNLILLTSVIVGLMVLQILGICFAQNLRADIFAQKAKWH